MTKRWLIRGFFIALLTLCVVAWSDSYWIDIGILRTHSAGEWGAGVDRGRIWLQWESHDDNSLPPHWTWLHLPPMRQWNDEDQRAKFHGLGFSFDEWRIPSQRDFGLTIPFWFSTFITALLLLTSWRRTRAKPPGRAFPVEPAAKPQ